MNLAWMLLIHWVADFLLQTREMGKLKSSNWGYLFAHISIIFIAFAVFYGWSFAFWNALFHAIIDRNVWNLYKLTAHWRINKKVDAMYAANFLLTQLHEPGLREELYKKEVAEWKFWEDKVFFDTIGFDQMLHGITLVVLANYFGLL